MYFFFKRIFVLLGSLAINSQSMIVSYAGDTGSEIFNDVLQLSNVHFIIYEGADNLSWIPHSTVIISLPHSSIFNVSGTCTAFFIEFDNTLQNILKVYRLSSGAAENFRL